MRQQQNVIELQQFIQTQSFLFYSDTHEYDSNTHQVDQLFVPLFFSSILFFFSRFSLLMWAYRILYVFMINLYAHSTAGTDRDT